MTNEKALKESSVGKLMVTLCLPVIMIMLVQVLYNMADVYFLGRTGDPLQVAAVSLASPVFSVFSALNTLIGFGGCTAASLALGRGKKELVKKYSSFVLYAGLILGVLLGAGTLIFMKPLLRVLGTDVQTAAHTQNYLRMMALGAPFAVAGGALSNTIRSDGDGKSAVMSNMTGTLLNILLDPLFISVFGWGVTGAGLATLLGNAVSFVMLLMIMCRKEAFSVSLRDFTIHPSVSIKILGLGFPMASGTLLASFSFAFSNRLLVSYGNTAVAANSVAGKASMLIIMIVMGLCMGMQPAISYAFGAKDRKRLRSILTGTGLISFVVAAVLSIAFYLARDAFVAAFLDDPQVLALGRRMIVGALLTAPVSGVYQLCSVYLQSTGKVSYATITALMQKGLVYIPVLYAMNTAFGLDGLIYAGAVADCISAVAAAFFCLAWAKAQKTHDIQLR